MRREYRAYCNYKTITIMLLITMLILKWNSFNTGNMHALQFIVLAAAAMNSPTVFNFINPVTFGVINIKWSKLRNIICCLSYE